MSTDHYATRSTALAWYKSSYSGTSGGDCVEVAGGLDAVYVRDSKSSGNGAVLRLGKDGWAAFIAHAAK
ncbi:DUF397 domain-containing protein [Streptomyces sp. NRRL F-5126]|uniref:DUF397 domain-containing protein n=1 Tax=Streptomyces sp. NRRL F-5126 TaxID=1463857 RepID=UPI0004C66C40|nr:DUF397 domain-containing protein [Streptomyces sp. NRRL F-5126]